MSLNCKEIDMILKDIPVNSIIKSFSSFTNNDLVINYHTEETQGALLIDISDNRTGIFRIPFSYLKKIKSEKSKFALLLDSRFKGSRIISIEQPLNSRVVIITLKLFDNYYKIISRLWGTGSNILLTDSNFEIIELSKRFPKRGEWPKEIYKIPEGKTDREFDIRNDIIKDNINDDLFFFYRNKCDKNKFDNLFSKLEKNINDQIKNIENQIQNVDFNINSEKHLIYKKFGDLINSNLYNIQSSDAECVILDDFETGQKFKVPLDITLSIPDNAKKYYEKYKKIKAGIEIWKMQHIQYLKTLEKYEHLRDKLNSSESYEDLANLEKKILSNKPEEIKKNDGKKKLPGRKISLSDGFTAYISRSSKEADELLKITAKGNDYWFHIRDNTGSHVVVKNIPSKELTDTARLEAAMLALHFSKSKIETEGDIYFTRVKYLHKPNNNTPGLVFPTQEKNIKVKKVQEVINNLLKGIE